ncbi:MAG: type IV pili methyl-accepting chemotaxis transducer N-terminal domain-containing protein, partial [Casimicrobiaceae bacterium]
MALKIFGDKGKAGAAALDMPTTQVRMGRNTPAGYDPLASVSIMDQLRNAGGQASVSRKLWVIGGLPVVKQFQLLLALLITFAVLALLMLFLDQRATSQAAAAAGTATEMQMLSQRLARGSALASQGQKQAFATVEDSRQKFGADLKALMEGGEVKGVSVDAVTSGAGADLLSEIKAKWDVVDKAAGRLVQNQDSLTSLAAGLERVNEANTSLLELSEQAGMQIAQAGGGVRDVDFANQLAVLSQRIAKNANALASGDEIDPETSFLLGKDAVTFRDVLNGLLKGSDALHINAVRGDDTRATLNELAKRFTAYDQAISSILTSMQKLTLAKASARTVNAASEDLLQKTTALADNWEGGGRAHVFALWAAIVFGVLALAALLALGKVFLDDARARASESEGENKRNQEAILRLLNEMGNLADGDLTVQASVTEDVTGAIADSINFTIE